MGPGGRAAPMPSISSTLVTSGRHALGPGGRDAADAINVDEPRGTPVTAPDFVSRLQALSALRDDGHLTDAEFAKAKQKLLDE